MPNLHVRAESPFAPICDGKKFKQQNFCGLFTIRHIVKAEILDPVAVATLAHGAMASPRLAMGRSTGNS